MRTQINSLLLSTVYIGVTGHERILCQVARLWQLLVRHLQSIATTTFKCFLIYCSNLIAQFICSFFLSLLFSIIVNAACFNHRRLYLWNTSGCIYTKYLSITHLLRNSLSTLYNHWLPLKPLTCWLSTCIEHQNTVTLHTNWSLTGSTSYCSAVHVHLSTSYCSAVHLSVVTYTQNTRGYYWSAGGADHKHSQISIGWVIQLTLTLPTDT